MGEHEIRSTDPRALRAFLQRVLDDLRALERMLDEGRFETAPLRLGAEQELFLVDRHRRPALAALDLLAALDDPHFTTELALFNLEVNLDPIPLAPDCLRRLEAGIDGALARARTAAAPLGVDVLLAGILPTLEKSDLHRGAMTPSPRYAILGDAIRQLRGREFELAIQGQDELVDRHDSVMLEACNTSFQVHLQVPPADFAAFYNLAQAVAAPLLAAATGSPLLFGKRLWRETRIALFEQAVDTRPARSHRRRLPPRVGFGERWVDASVLELFRENVTRFRALLSRQDEEDPLAVLAAGGTPRLAALALHNGTVYRWNRPCYGVIDGRPHLRIENRVLPAGPSVVDEVANAALWIGLLHGLHRELGDVRRHLAFDTVKESFFAAARIGLRAELGWTGGRTVPASELLLSELLPVARSGLRGLGVDPDDVDRYLDVVAERVARRKTGAQWLLDSLAAMGDAGTPAERLAALTAASLARQRGGAPVHAWELARLDELDDQKPHCTRVAALMTTDLVTVGEDEVVDLAASVMDWRHIRHLPVEDEAHRLVGLVTHRALLRFLAAGRGRIEPTPVREVMEREVVTVEPGTLTLDAMRLMRERGVSALPVVEDGRLVGIVTERDLIRLARPLLEAFLQAGQEGVVPPELEADDGA